MTTRIGAVVWVVFLAGAVSSYEAYPLISMSPSRKYQLASRQDFLPLRTSTSRSMKEDTSTQMQESPPKVAKVSSERSISSVADICRNYLIGTGQDFGDRQKLHELNMTREFTDPQLWTHGFFLGAAYCSYSSSLHELTGLLLVTTFLSLRYHYTYERPGFTAQVEGLVAKLLFLYGFLQLFQAPTWEYMVSETTLMLFTVGVFTVTNVRKDLYDRWHCLMHVFPAIWAGIVGLYHPPMLFH